VKPMKSVCWALLWLIAASVTTVHAQNATITGRVVDARSQQALARVVVHAEHQSTFAETDATGAFTLSLPPGKHTIAASVIGYATVRHVVDVSAGSTQALAIELSEGAGSYEEVVTVAGSVPDEADRAPGGSVLHGRDLQALRGVMLDDPLRAVQALPAATSTDDFHSEFSVRGSSFRHVGLAIDGIPAPYLIHSIHEVMDGGSITMVNSEALGAASLRPGSYSQRLGRRLGAQIDLTTRDGNRDAFRGRLGLSGTSANVIGEGPFASGRGTWVASVRRSYLDFLLDRIDPEGSFGFGFSDALGKVTFDVNPRHQLKWLSVVGRSLFDEAPEDLGPNDEAEASSRAWLTAVTWRYTPAPRLALSQSLYVTGMDFKNVSKHDVLLDRGQANDIGWRADVAFAPHDGLIAEFGGDVLRSTAGRARQRTFDGATEPVLLSNYSAAGRAASAYAQLSARVGKLTLTPGGRVDYWQATATTTSSPWITGDWAMTRTTQLRGGAGIYRQFPDLTMLNGLNGNVDLRPERARHADLGIVQTFSNSISVQVTGYRRDERDVLRIADSEPRRLADGTIVLGRGDAPWSNRLAGRAYGVEAILRRDAPDSLSGWIAYGYSEHRYHDAVTDERFWSDYDQRHTVSTYALYRLSNRSSIGAKFRYGSNYPITGYVGQQSFSPNAPALLGGDRPVFFGLTDRRNTLRLPAYARLDVRADRAVTWGGRRATLFVEVANVLNRRNERNVPSAVGRNGQLHGVTDSLLPIVPSAGFVIEF
jgi:outer membrane cobalamin receptor